MAKRKQFLIPLCVFAVVSFLQQQKCVALSAGGSKDAGASYTLFDRFRADCPADPSSVVHFDPSLATYTSGQEKDSSIWVAVYRYSNNKPSVLIKDEFLRAMRSATDSSDMITETVSAAATHSSRQGSPLIESAQIAGVRQQAPVAVARLIPSSHRSESWQLDCMKCVLKKEDTDMSCDGNSEHNEAISVAIDALLEHYLSFCDRFEGAIRTKATLFSARILEERGFEPVSKLELDMATHISSLDACMERYAERSISTISKSPGARQRALNIVSRLGQLNRDQELKVARENMDKEEDERNDYDPWAGSMIR